MSILTAVEIADLHATWEDALIDTCQIKATTKVTAGAGYTTAWPAVTATVICALEDIQAGAAGLGGEIDILSGQNAKTIWVKRGTVVAAPDRIIHDGITYEVARVTKPGTYGPGIACICSEVG